MRALQAAQAESAALRMEVQVGSSIRVCVWRHVRVEPFCLQVPACGAAPAWGLRCVQGAVQWTVFLPITIQAWGLRGCWPIPYRPVRY